MAFPKDHGEISTNLTPIELEELIKAIESGEAKHVPGSTNMFAESAGCDFTWLGSTFHMEEWCEMVTNLYLK